MLPDYSDIRERIDADPAWFDGYGVPRYADFTPDMLGVYDVFALLLEIECQSCRRRFLVGEGWPRYSLVGEPRFYNLEELASGYHYGDPPRHQCGGDSMNCVDLRIVEAWERSGQEWSRRDDVERIDVYPDWADSGT